MHPNLPDVAAELHARGVERLEAGDLEQADEHAARAAELLASIDREHPDHASALLLRARVAHARSDYRAAIACAEGAAEILAAARLAYPGEDIVVRLGASASAQRAGALLALGRYDDAEHVLLEALADVEAVLGRDAEEVGELCTLLGIGHKYQARYDEAAARYARAGEIIRTHHGDDSVEVASLEHNLGGLAHARGETAAGEPHARRAVLLREAALGPDHPQVASDLAAWAALLDDLGRFDEAEAALRRALAIFERAYGPQHFEVGFTLASLAALFAGRERWQDALPLLARARAVLVAVLGDDHVEVARVDQYLAVVEHGRGDRAAALVHAERALAVCERALAANHPRVIDARETRDALTKSPP